MATNKPFANLDKLSKKVLPAVPPFNPEINQGQSAPPANTQFADQLNLADRYKQPSYKTTNHLPQFFTSDVATDHKANTNFRRKISLADRLQQSQLGSTNHLSQYFLSDTFTGVIRIKPLAQQQLAAASSVQITQPSGLRTIKRQGSEDPRIVEIFFEQGGELPTAAVETIDKRQGIITRRGVKESGITIKALTAALPKSGEQGVVVGRGFLRSSVEVESPTEKVEQGSTIITVKPFKSKEQGGEKPTQTKSQDFIQASQGIFASNLGLSSVIDPEKPTKKVGQGIIAIGGREESAVVPETPAYRLNQGYVGLFGVNFNNSIVTIQSPTPPGGVAQGEGSNPNLPTGTIVDGQVPIRQGEITLQTLGFLAQGISLIAAPEAIQGGEMPTNELPGETGHEITHLRSRNVS